MVYDFYGFASKEGWEKTVRKKSASNEGWEFRCYFKFSIYCLLKRFVHFEAKVALNLLYCLNSESTINMSGFQLPFVRSLPNTFFWLANKKEKKKTIAVSFL